MFDDYLVLGGFPALKYFGLERSPSIQYLQSVLDTVIVRDVIEHHQVRDVDLFRRLIRYCIGNIGRTFSARSVVRRLKSEGRAVSVDTVLNHLDFCIGAHLIAGAGPTAPPARPSAPRKLPGGSDTIPM